jgi:hypothetical protein
MRDSRGGGFFGLPFSAWVNPVRNGFLRIHKQIQTAAVTELVGFLRWIRGAYRSLRQIVDRRYPHLVPALNRSIRTSWDDETLEIKMF